MRGLGAREPSSSAAHTLRYCSCLSYPRLLHPCRSRPAPWDPSVDPHLTQVRFTLRPLPPFSWAPSQAHCHQRPSPTRPHGQRGRFLVERHRDTRTYRLFTLCHSRHIRRLLQQDAGGSRMAPSHSAFVCEPPSRDSETVPLQAGGWSPPRSGGRAFVVDAVREVGMSPQLASSPPGWARRQTETCHLQAGCCQAGTCHLRPGTLSGGNLSPPAGRIVGWELVTSWPGRCQVGHLSWTRSQSPVGTGKDKTCVSGSSLVV